MRIKRSVDIEDVIRTALNEHITAYCRPLPKEYRLPNILVTQVGGADRNNIDSFEVVLDARAKTEETASLTLRNAIGILKEIAAEQSTAIRYITVNTNGSWDFDPVRPDLALCTARIRVTAHMENVEVN
ncbi:MAG: hypothetical protein K5886_02810 [Lachnospiraceae bacterium]|nr:hypothetical protein [Lachnospiraceae bacterium]